MLNIANIHIFDILKISGSNTVNEKEIFKMHADFCKFMGNPKRIEILFLLNDREMSVDEMAAKMDIRVSNLSQHLAIMRDRGVVSVRREGTRIYYTISNDKIITACLMMRDVMFEQMKSKIKIIRNAEVSGRHKGV